MRVKKKGDLVFVYTDYEGQDIEDAVYVITAKDFRCEIPNASHDIIFGGLDPKVYMCEVYINGKLVDKGEFFVAPKNIKLDI